MEPGRGQGGHHHVELQFIDPGKPIQDAFIESFNSRFRDECLNAPLVHQSGRRPTAYRSLAVDLAA